MKQLLAESLDSLIDAYCAERDINRLWRRPVVRYGDAKSEHFPRLRQVAFSDHALPEDFLRGATIIVSYFLPFVEEVGTGNIRGEMASKSWAEAYLTTNAMAAVLNQHLSRVVNELGYRAEVPYNIGFDADILMSRWSQRHVAWLSGHGTFGLNNMLIGEMGCCGRYFSIVTDLPVEPDPIVEGENCVYKRSGACKVCVKRCLADALTESGYDRKRCYVVCLKNQTLYEGAEVCGKCVVGLPCSFKKP